MTFALRSVLADVDTSSTPSWVDDVFFLARSFLKTYCVSQEQQRLLEAALEGLRSEEAQGEDFSFIQVPLLVFGALRGDVRPALPLAVATTLLFLGIDILDDVADGDKPSWWEGWRASEIHLAAATLLATLPQMAIAGLAVDKERRMILLETLFRGLLKMSAGQLTDLSMNGRTVVSASEIERSVAKKSGEELALFAALAAQFAGASASVVAHYESMGSAMGTAGQLASDCYDIFQAAHSKDLANGTRTLPMALYLEKASAKERRSFLELDDTQEIRNRLREADVLRFCALIIELHVQRALRELKEVQALEPASGELGRLIEKISLFGKGGTP